VDWVYLAQDREQWRAVVRLWSLVCHDSKLVWYDTWNKRSPSITFPWLFHIQEVRGSIPCLERHNPHRKYSCFSTGPTSGTVHQNRLGTWLSPTSEITTEFWV
jgi:hypothetical protein